jgi:hypothetical protein
MFGNLIRRSASLTRRAGRSVRRPRFEPLESRSLLAVGPFLHVHNVDQLAVVDSSSGELEVIARMTGFAGDDQAMNDIAFSASGRLYGIARDWLYEIHPVTGELTPLGQHGLSNVSALIGRPDGSLQAMGRSQPDLYRLTVNDTSLVNVTRIAALSGIDPTEGSNGDITYFQGDLLVATTDDRLIRYRFDINPDRPRLIQEVDLADLEVTDVFGLATVGSRLFATAGTSVFELGISQPPTATEVTLTNSNFGDMRGAAYFAEAGGPVPVGTLSGVKWFDRNKDGIRQNNEPALADWSVFIDTNLNGTRDTGEPLRQTDANGQYFFFGREPGFYTVDEIIPDTSQWEQTFPRTPHPNIVGLYSFDDGRGSNQLSHDSGLPDLTSSLVSFGGGSAQLNSAASFLELPRSLGDSPFTILVSASYTTIFGSEQYLLSQQAGTSDADRDFHLTVNPTTRGVTASFCSAQGNCQGELLGTVDQTLHQYGITWDGELVGNFFDGQLATERVTGTRPDIDGQVVRFGNPRSLPAAAGLRGTLAEIRIYSRALSQTELAGALEAPFVGNPYTVLLDDERGLDGLDFGNGEPTVVEMNPEIEVARGAIDGPEIVNGGEVDLGTASSSDAPLQTQIFITNTGDEPLDIPTVAVSAGFQLEGPAVTSLAPGQSTSFRVTLIDATQGIKSGEIRIDNNDADENPFVIRLRAEIFDPDTRPRDILINTSAGNVLRIDPTVGTPQTVATGLPVMTDIAYDSRTDRLYGIDATFLYEINLADQIATTLFAHNVPGAAALGVAPSGDIFAAGEHVFRLDVLNETSQKFSNGGAAIAGDIAFLGNRMLMSTANGDLYEIEPNSTTRLGTLGGAAMNGLAATGTNTLYGFSNNQAFLINVDALSVTPQFGLMVFTVAGATFEPKIRAHNPNEPPDVNGDGFVVPLDALLVINELNERQFSDPTTGRLLTNPVGETRFPDINNDGLITPLDALLIINRLNSLPAPAVAAAAADTVMAEAEDAADLAAVRPLRAQLGALLVRSFDVDNDNDTRRPARRS